MNNTVVPIMGDEVKPKVEGASNGSDTAASGGDAPSGLLSKAGGGLLSKAGTVTPSSGGDQKPSGLLAKAAAGGAETGAITTGVKTPADDSLDARAAKRRALGHPDPDTIKMFAGQVPRRMEEPELRNVFEEFGNVYQINILRDRITGNSRGCCFVTYFTRKSALAAQNALHNLRTLPGMHHPMQMKPADAENRSERKLFVGMVGKQCDDEDIWSMFEKFGPIEECTVLRDSSGSSKGCAFVTFMSRHCAIAAIRGLHHSKTMEGCSAALVVKFADSQRDRDMTPRRFGPVGMGGGSGGPPMIGGPNQQQQQQQRWGQQNNNSGGGWGQQNQQTNMPPSMQAPPPNAMNNNMMMNPQAMQLLQQLSQAASQLSSLAATGGVPNVMGPPPAMGNNQQRFGLPPPIAGQQQQPQQQQGGFNNQANNPAGALAMMLQAANTLTQGSRPQGSGNFSGPPPAGTSNFNNTGTGFNNAPAGNLGNNTNTGFGSNVNTGNNFGNPPPFQQNQNNQFNRGAGPASSSPAAGRQIEGPDGCNLFIYHLPQQCNDADLAGMFAPFGNVISAKVFVDKVTGASKCFGFVSYDLTASAEAAIQGMNNFMIGGKRLKVQPKRTGGDLNKPY